MNEFLKKYKEMSIQAKSALWFVFCTLLQKGISFITGPIFTRMMSTEQYGTYSLYLSWYQIMTIITSLYLSAGIFTNAMNKFKDDRDSYISSMQGITITLTTCCFIIYIIAPRFWSTLFGLNSNFILLMFCELIVAPAFSFWASKQRFIYRYKRLVGLTLVKSFFNPVLGIIAVYLAEQKDLARVASMVFIEIIFCGLLLILNFKRGRKFYDRGYWKYALNMALPLLPHYLSGVILNQGDRVVIDKLCGASDVALYSVAYTIGMLVQIFTNSVANSLSPWIYDHINRKDYVEVRKKLNFVMFFFYAIILCLMLLSPEIIAIFGSEKYAGAVYVIPPVAASTFFIYLYSILATLLFYYEKTKFMMFSSAGAAVMNIILNYIFVDKYGFVAAGYTTLICYILYCIGIHIMSKNIARKYNSCENIYDSKTTFIISCVIVGTCVLANFLIDMPIARYIIFVGIGTVLFIKRKSLVNLIHKI